jgi:hypothetical protein
MKAKRKGEERRHTTSTLNENCQPKFFRKVHVKAHTTNYTYRLLTSIEN